MVLSAAGPAQAPVPRDAEEGGKPQRGAIVIASSGRPALAEVVSPRIRGTVVIPAQSGNPVFVDQYTSRLGSGLRGNDQTDS